jgi:AcrR family transcriptional regulator
VTLAKKSYHHGDLKNALLRAGMQVLEQDGLPGLSLRSIAARVGVSHTAPKNHFGSLRGLLTALATEGFLLHAAEMQKGIDAATDAPTRQKAAMLGYVAFARAHPQLFALMFSPLYYDYTDPAFHAAGQQSYAILAGISKGLDWDKAGEPGADRRAEMMLWSIVHGYATLLLGGHFHAGPMSDRHFDITDIMPVFGYLGSDTPPSTRPES